MTALTMIIGLFPLIVATGAGANGNRSLGVVIAPPCTAADGPGAHAEKWHLNAAFANIDVLHIFSLHASSVPRNGKQSYKRWHSLLYASDFMKKEPQLRDIPAPQLSFNSDITELAQFQHFVVGLSPAHRPVGGEPGCV